MEIKIKHDGLLYHSILSINNFIVNKEIRFDKASINSANRYLKILNNEKIYTKSDYFKYLIQACKDLKKDDIITLEVKDFQVQNQSLETRTRVHIYCKTYQKNYSY